MSNLSTWALDASHSEIQFKVKHLMISTVTGQFTRFDGTVTTIGDDFGTAKIEFTADIDSISTNNDHRDAHLKNGDFFDAENHPKLLFASDKLVKVGEDEFKLHGKLTIKGVTNDIILSVEFGGIMNDPWGNIRSGFSITGKINRQDFGISFGSVSETGGVMLGDEVKLFANVELVKQAEAELVMS